MRHWTFWDWIAYTCLLVGAMIFALDEGLKIAPDVANHVPFLTSPIWGFVPFVLILVATIIFVFRMWRGTPSPRRHTSTGTELANPSIHFPTPDWHEPLRPIVNQTYRNETVELDGKAFNDCSFENVTFKYNGTKPTQFINCRRPTGEQEYIFQTDNPSVQVTTEIIHWLRIKSGEQGTLTRNLINRNRH